MDATLVIDALTGCAYVVLAALILLQAKRSRTGVLLACACLATAAWALATGVRGDAPPFGGVGGAFDLVRAAVWYGFILHLYRQALPNRGAPGRVFLVAGAVIVLGTAAMIVLGAPSGGPVTLLSGPITLRLFGALSALLLLENLVRNSSEELRARLQLACLALGGLSAYDVLVCADAALFHRVSLPLAAGRPVVALIVVPLLALAAARNQRWAVGIHVSRTAVFYSATLVVSGIFLLALAAAGELLRQFSPLLTPQWGAVAQIGLGFAGLLGLVMLMTSANSRSWLRALLVDHFFTHRYDYRREWLRCIETLSDGQRSPGIADVSAVTLQTRAIRSVAQLVDSPAGVLLLRDGPAAPLTWAGAWQITPASLSLAADHQLTERLMQDADAALLSTHPEWAVALEDAAGAGHPAWLGVPLHQHGALIGCILVAPPRASFPLDREVFDLLRTVASEIATHLAEQRAARALHETRDLRDYAQRFAFVAHDVKNVSSQLSMLLSNAQVHIGNPLFQRDMLTTVQASVNKIDALIRRLGTDAASPPAAVSLVPVVHVRALAGDLGRLRGVDVTVEHDGLDAMVAMDPPAFDAVITHLLNNAIEASDAPGPVTIRLRQHSGRVTIDIIDQGRGMTPEFVRDGLFRPFQTSKRQGSGVGAFQARALLHAAGGDLHVTSRPGVGTSMRIWLPCVETPHTHAMLASGSVAA